MPQNVKLRFVAYGHVTFYGDEFAGTTEELTFAGDFDRGQRK